MNNLIKITKKELVNQINNDNIFLILKDHYYKDILKFNELFKNNLINEITTDLIKKYNNDFNKNAFINWNDFGSDEKVIEEIARIDNDDNLFMDYINEKIVANNDLFTVDYILTFFDKIITI